MSTEHEGLRAWSLERRLRLLRHRKTGASIRANRRRNCLYHKLGRDKWAAMYKRHRMKD